MGRQTDGNRKAEAEKETKQNGRDTQCDSNEKQRFPAVTLTKPNILTHKPNFHTDRQMLQALRHFP